ncbi:hypothetical protein LSH36_242g01033 [Paralvinella palmiformis]|uniref:Tetraspanin n=1 Tax=Paralvinella palmiformis TaxID=53620 RepID=A0AAD9N534_9ANNE|nr:hypothetical protein LSH36_242g01033 [Paralvinella palmiformis]
MGSSSPECCAKVCLVVVNVVFQLLGVILLVIGIILKTGWVLLDKYVFPLLGSGDDTTTQSSIGDVSITDSLSGALASSSYVFIGLGIFILVAGFLGCAGACCKIRTLLIIYVVLIVLVLLAQLIFIILLSTDKLNDSIKTNLKNEINQTYGGISDKTVTSLSFNAIMMQYNCCGVENFEEFLWASKWNRFYQIEVDGSTENVTLQIPIACCKTTGAFPEVDLLTPNCTWDPNIDNSNMNNILCMCIAIYMILRVAKEEMDGKINPWTD